MVLLCVFATGMWLRQKANKIISFNAFFTRDLQPGVRPIASNTQLVSPVDGTISQIGAKYTTAFIFNNDNINEINIIYFQ